MTLEEIRKAKAAQNVGKKLAKYKLCELDINSDIESICTRLAHKYFDVDNTFCVYVNFSFKGTPYSESFENQVENLFIMKRNEFPSIESIEFYDINHVIFNKK